MLVKAKETVFVGGSRRKAGAIFEYSGEITPQLELVKADAPIEVKAATETPELTRNEIKLQLDQAGIKYATNDTKDTLLSLLNGAKSEVAPAATSAPSKEFVR
jgi:hypothetical protein